MIITQLEKEIATYLVPTAADALRTTVMTALQNDTGEGAAA